MGGGTSSSSGSERFSRIGSTGVSSMLSVPESVKSLLQNQITGGSGPVFSALERVGTRDATLPGFSTLINTANTVNPYSSTYEDDTADAFDERANRVLALATSGPEAVHAPLARGKSLRESEVAMDLARERTDVVERQRGQDVNNLMNMITSLYGQSGQHGATWVQGQNQDMSAVSNLINALYDRSQTATENLRGEGVQSASGYSFGVDLGRSCCFIFLEAYNGKMPWWVRKCRDQFAPESSDRRNGYIKMSKWLVPWMKRSKTVRKLVNFVMIQPLTKWGGFHKNVRGYQSYGYLKPVVNFWFKLWELYGKV
jgi:hypothetical protein